MTQLTLKTYYIIERAVSEGIEYGLRRAYKHVDNPDRDQITMEIEQAVMQSLDEVVDFARDIPCEP